jgi:hypothetical protein
MTRAFKAGQAKTPRRALGLYDPPAAESHVARWRINGHHAVIVIWTAEEWEKLSVQPNDAQFYPCGVWCALRVE